MAEVRRTLALTTVPVEAPRGLLVGEGQVATPAQAPNPLDSAMPTLQEAATHRSLDMGAAEEEEGMGGVEGEEG